MKKLAMVCSLLIGLTCLAADKIDSTSSAFITSSTITNTVGKATGKFLEMYSFTLSIPTNATLNTFTFKILREDITYVAVSGTFTNSYLYYFDSPVVVLPTDIFYVTNSVASNCVVTLNYGY